MAPHLRPEVIAAIETAVECNEGVLESAFIHSLAKIYKTSPQAVVWNMKRYNKVKAGCDDRQKTGRHAVMDKDVAAEYTKEMLKETPGLRMDKIGERLHERFGVQVSNTWVSRLMKRYGIVYKEPKPTVVKEVQIPKPPKPPRVPQKSAQVLMSFGEEDQPAPTVTPQYPLPPPGHYPSFRDDLQQAIRAPAVGSSSSSSGSESEHMTDVYYGILKPSKSLPPPPPAPPRPYYYPPPQYQYPPVVYQPQMRSPISPARPPAQPRQAPKAAAAPETVWKVVNVIELG